MFFLNHFQTVFGTNSFIFMVSLIIFVIYSRGPICFNNILLVVITHTRQWHPLQYSCLENPMDGGAL